MGGLNFRNVLGDLAAAMPQAVTVTPEEREAIERVSSIIILVLKERCIKSNI